MVIKTAWSGGYYRNNRNMCRVALLSAARSLPGTPLEVYCTSPEEAQELLELVPGLGIFRIPDLDEDFEDFYDWSKFFILSRTEEPRCVWLDPDTIFFKSFDFGSLDLDKIYAFLGEHWWTAAYSLRGFNFSLKEVTCPYPFSKNLDLLGSPGSYGFNRGIIYFPKKEHAQVYGKAGLEGLAALASTRDNLRNKFLAHHFVAQSYLFRVLRQEGIVVDSFFRLVHPSPEGIETGTYEEEMLGVYRYLFPFLYHRCYNLITLKGDPFMTALDRVLPQLETRIRQGKEISFSSFYDNMMKSITQLEDHRSLV